MALVYAAALTPLRDGGDALDEEVCPAYADFLERGGVAGVLALGTTGEGILLELGERMRVVELFLDASFEVIAHCGAQSTRTTVELAAHAAERGAHGVAVIAPPYFQLDDRALLKHFAAAAAACVPTPFYIYEFARASGYAVPTAVIAQGLEHGAAGAVSALASALPERVVAVDLKLAELRAAIERFPRHAALKRIVARRGVPIREDVRAPLRGLTPDERTELDAWFDALS